VPEAPTVGQLRAALDAVEPLVAGIPDGLWTAPTPCTDWDVRALVAHVVAGNRLIADVLAGLTTVEEFRAAAPADPLGDDPLAAYRAAGDAVVAAFTVPGALERPVTVPFGTVPGAVALHLRLTDVLVHGWDLARATGQQAAVPPGLAEQELAFSAGAVQQLPPGRSPFDAPQEAPEDAPALDRLAALLGRTIG